MHSCQCLEIKYGHARDHARQLPKRKRMLETSLRLRKLCFLAGGRGEGTGRQRRWRFGEQGRPQSPQPGQAETTGGRRVQPHTKWACSRASRSKQQGTYLAPPPYPRLCQPPPYCNLLVNLPIWNSRVQLYYKEFPVINVRNDGGGEGFMIFVAFSICTVPWRTYIESSLYGQCKLVSILAKFSACSVSSKYTPNIILGFPPARHLRSCDRGPLFSVQDPIQAREASFYNPPYERKPLCRASWQMGEGWTQKS